MTREEIEAVRNHISNIPSLGAAYAPVLLEWLSVLLRQRNEARAELFATQAELQRTEYDRDAMRVRARRCDDAFRAVWVAASDWINGLPIGPDGYPIGPSAELSDAVRVADTLTLTSAMVK